MLGLLLLLAFTVLPLVELALLLRVGERLGAGPTLGLVLATGLLGAALARWQGAAAWRAIQVELAQGRLPGRQIVEGLLVFAAALLLVTPGVLTDAAGFLLLVPPARRIAAAGLVAWGRSRVQVVGEAGGLPPPGFGPGGSPPPPGFGPGGFPPPGFGRGPTGFEPGPTRDIEAQVRDAEQS